MIRIVITALIFSVFHFNSKACRCQDPGNVRNAYESTPIIFHGKVLNKVVVALEETINPAEAIRIKEDLKGDETKLAFLKAKTIYKVSIEIMEKFKGNFIKNTVTVYTPIGGGSCGFHAFEKNKEFVVYAFITSSIPNLFLDISDTREITRKNTYWTSHCTRTTDAISSEVRELTKIKREKTGATK